MPTGRPARPTPPIHRLWQLLLKGLDEVARRADAARGRRNGAAARHPRLRAARSGRAAREAGERRGGRRRAAPRAATAESQGAMLGAAGEFPGAGRRSSSAAARRILAHQLARIAGWSNMRRPSLLLQAAREVRASGVEISSATLRDCAEATLRPEMAGRASEGAAQPTPARAGAGGRGRALRRRCSTRRWSRPRSRPFPTPSLPATPGRTTERVNARFRTKS